MWICPKCGAEYVQKNMWHSCVRYSEGQFLEGKPARAVALYRYFLKEYRKIGPIKLHVVKSRIAFMVKVRFSGVSGFGKDFIRGGFWLKEKIQSDKFFRIEYIPKNNFIHYFKIFNESDIDQEFRRYMKMAYEIGERKHLKRKINS
jgi:hypothetical protein